MLAGEEASSFGWNFIQKSYQRRFPLCPYPPRVQHRPTQSRERPQGRNRILRSPPAYSTSMTGLRSGQRALPRLRPQGCLHKAACLDEDPELFYPSGSTGTAVVQIAQVKAVCNRCPVRTECRAWALATGEQHGIWGGMSEDEHKQNIVGVADAATTDDRVRCRDAGADCCVVQHQRHRQDSTSPRRTHPGYDVGWLTLAETELSALTALSRLAIDWAAARQAAPRPD
jgi:WhiB family transcriptional regulator, redox-sensing transcriptional regulator